MELKVYNTQGKETGRSIQLSDAVFGVEPNDHAIYLDVKQILANKRQGTHKSKERSEMSGSTRKLRKQKGGGGARIGDINSPILVGGARVFGPKPRDYSFKLNKKVKQLARKSALTHKAVGNQIMVVEDFIFDAPKTKKMIELLNNLKIIEKKSLFVLFESNKNVTLSSGNLPNIKVINQSDLNTYEILNNNNLVFSEKALNELINLYTK